MADPLLELDQFDLEAGELAVVVDSAPSRKAA